MKLKILAITVLLLVSQGCAADNSKPSNASPIKTYRSYPSVSKSSDFTNLDGNQSSFKFSNGSLGSGSSPSDSSSPNSSPTDDLDRSGFASDSSSGISSTSGNLTGDSQAEASGSSPQPSSSTSGPLKAEGSEQTQPSFSSGTIDSGHPSQASSSVNSSDRSNNLGTPSSNSQPGDRSWQNQFNFDSSSPDKSRGIDSSQSKYSQTQSDFNNKQSNYSQNQSSFGGGN